MADRGFFRSDGFRLAAAVAWLAIFVLRPRLTFAVTLLAVGGAMIAFNAVVFWRTRFRREHASSVVPIFGGILGAAGIALLPLAGSWHWAWLPLVVDWGGLPRLVAAAFGELPR